MKKRHILLASLLVSCFTLSSLADTAATDSGSWDDPGIWDNGVPVLGEITSIANNHTVTIKNGTDAEAGRLGTGQGTLGHLIVEDGASLTLSANQELRVGWNRQGIMTIQGGLVTVPDLLIGYSTAQANGTLDMSGGSLLVTRANFRIGSQGNGTLNLSGGTIGSQSTINVGHGDNVNSRGGWFNQTGGSVIASNNNALVIGRTATAQESVYHISGGTLTALGTVTLSDAGQDGNQSAIMRVTGTDAEITVRDLTIGAYGTYMVDLDATGNGVSTVVATGGNASQHINLAGTLSINALGASVPSTVVLFKMEGAGQILGTFDDVVWNDGLEGEVKYSSSEVWLEVIPEPTALGLVFVGLIGLAWGRRFTS